MGGGGGGVRDLQKMSADGRGSMASGELSQHEFSSLLDAYL